MLNLLKTFKENKNNIDSVSDEDKGIMVPLLMEAAKSDDSFSDSEITKIKNIISKKLHFEEACK